MIKKILLIVLLANFSSVKAQLTPPANLQSYYMDVDFSLTGIPLFDNLATETISKHTTILDYNQRHNYLYNADKDLTNSANVILMYNSESRDKREYLSGNNSHSPQTFNTEHVYPQSLIVNNAKGDLHHLRSCDEDINSARSNNPFAAGSGSYKNLGSSWYPGDEWKGDVARMIMYLNLRYDESFSDVGSLALFLQWNAEDPVSNFEKQRNEIIATVQGNRNPFIDNPFLATVIWGGTAAENTWGTPDTEVPSVPTNVILSTITASSIDITWSASSDNEGISKYEIYANGILNGETSSINYTVSGLTDNTSYSIAVLAKDFSGNKSALSAAVTGTTLTDTETPTVPTNVTITGQSGTSFTVNWNASSDNSAVVGYDIFVDGNLKGTTNTATYTVTGLSVSTTYSVRVLAKDAANNVSAQSAAISATTTDGSAASNELFFSEYLEGGGNNKAIEIANFTGQTVSLANYVVKLGANGQNFGTNTLSFTNETIANGEVFVIGNPSMTICASEIDIASEVTFFNGNDALGLFKNNILIDIIGKEGNNSKFGENVTLKRKPSIVGPNTVYNANDLVECSGVDDCTDLGKHNISTASVDDAFLDSFKIFPNPTNGNTLFINSTEQGIATIYNLLGKRILVSKITSTKKPIDITNLTKGIYLIKINTDGKTATKKFIKN
jgi:endonuclease I/chitodextrinase